MVSVERLNELLAYDAKTGVFRWKVRRSTTSPAGSVAGRTESKGYIQIGIDGVRYMAHRLVWLLHHGEVAGGMVIDHVDGNRGNNRIANLRVVSFTKNLHLHRAVHPKSRSKLLGVSFNVKTAVCGKPWVARIQRFGKRVTLGSLALPKQRTRLTRKQEEPKIGWLFGWSTRKELVDHLCEGNGVTTLKRRFVGNTLYTVNAYEQANGTVIKYACVYLLKGRSNTRYGWGYKDMDETMHPYYYDFPVSWLDLLSPIDSEYALEWRANARKRAEQMARFKIGTTWAYAGHEYTIIERRSPTSFRVKDQWGDTWRMKMSQLLHAEEVKK